MSMTKHGDRTKHRRHRKRSKDVKFKTRIDSTSAEVNAVENESGPIEAVVHPLPSLSLSAPKQLVSPKKLLEKPVLPLPKKASKKRKRKKSATDDGVLDIAASQMEASASSNDVKGTFVFYWMECLGSMHISKPSKNVSIVVLLGQFLCYSSDTVL
jgi:hypothetical protein